MSLPDVSCRDVVIQTDLHQAIEAKEHVKVRRESKTLATITFQNFFNKYDKKSWYDRYSPDRGKRVP